MHKRKTTVGKVIVSIVLLFLVGALMIFTASRTIDFLQMTFPPSFGYMAYLALAAFDGGILVWSVYATYGAEGATQCAIAYCMIFVCLVGVALTTIADTVLSSSKNGLVTVPPYMAPVAVWGSVAVILLNVLAGIAVHLSSPHHVRKFELESIHDEIHALTIQHIRESALEIAPQIAREQANHWVRVTIQDAVGSLPTPKQQLTALPSPIVDADPVEEIEEVPVSSKNQVLDPTNVRAKVDSEKKSLAKKSLVDFSLPKGANGKATKKIETVEETPDEKVPVEETPDEQETIENGPSSDDPSQWTMADWRKYRNEVDAWTFDQTWQEYHGDVDFPDDRPVNKKKGKRTKSVTRRQVLGMEKQDD